MRGIAQYVQRLRQPSAIFTYALPGKDRRCSRHGSPWAGALVRAPAARIAVNLSTGEELDDPQRVTVAEEAVDLGKLARQARRRSAPRGTPP